MSLRGDVEHTVAATAMARETSLSLVASWVVIMPNLQEAMNLARASTFSCREGGVSSLFASVYGSAGLLPVSVLEKEEDMLIE